MTVGEMVIEVFEQLGEPSDINPLDGTGAVDAASYGYGRILMSLNAGQRAIASWKDPSTGHLFRFRSCFGQRIVQTNFIQATLATNGTVDSFVLPTGTYANNSLRGQIAKIGNETRLVVANTGTTVVVAPSFTNAPVSGDAVAIYRRWVEIGEIGSIIDVMKVYDVEGATELEHAAKIDGFLTSMTEIQTPSSWYRSGDKILFDTAPAERRWYMLETYELPAAMVNPTDEPTLPEQFHYGIVLWALAWGFSRMIDVSKKRSLQSDFNLFMRSTASELDLSGEREQDSFVPRLQ